MCMKANCTWNTSVHALCLVRDDMHVWLRALKGHVRCTYAAISRIMHDYYIAVSNKPCDDVCVCACVRVRVSIFASALHIRCCHNP